jgi:hypothetical protein
LNNIGFIKIDVEDNELQTLRFSQETLKRSNYPPILFEMNNQNDELTNFFNSLNYKTIKLDNCDNMFLATIN